MLRIVKYISYSKGESFSISRSLKWGKMFKFMKNNHPNETLVGLLLIKFYKHLTHMRQISHMAHSTAYSCSVRPWTEDPWGEALAKAICQQQCRRSLAMVGFIMSLLSWYTKSGISLTFLRVYKRLNAVCHRQIPRRLKYLTHLLSKPAFVTTAPKVYKSISNYKYRT